MPLIHCVVYIVQVVNRRNSGARNRLTYDRSMVADNTENFLEAKFNEFTAQRTGRKERNKDTPSTICPWIDPAMKNQFKVYQS